MSWITETAATTSLEAILGQRPELLERYRAFYKTFWEDGLVPRRTLEICRLRIAHIHECAAELAIRDAQVPLAAAEVAGLKRGDFSGFLAAEQVALNLAEQIPYQHHQITDAQMADAAAELTTPGAVSLLTALAFFDVGCRLRIVLDVGEEPRQLTQPPLDQGALA
jgi:hypothetical protein